MTKAPDLSRIPPQAVLAEIARRTGQQVEAVSPEERERRREEQVKCALDAVYWIDTYAYTYDPRLPDPYVRFRLFPRQIEFLHWLEERWEKQQGGCIEKSRDVGASFIAVAFLLHKWMYSQGFAGGLGSRKLEYVDNRDDPKTLFEKMRVILKRLPLWMLPRGFDWKKHDLEAKLINPSKQSSIVGEGGARIGQGGRTSIFLVDEYNLLEHPELAESALTDNTNVFLRLGTPEGLKGIATLRNTLPTFTFSWIDDPRKNRWEERQFSHVDTGARYTKYGPPVEHDRIIATGNGRHPTAPVPRAKVKPERLPNGNIVLYPWYEARRLEKKSSLWELSQNQDIDYLGSGRPRFDREFIHLLSQGLPDPLYEQEPGEGWHGTVTVYQEYDLDRQYFIVADVAEGESEEGDPDFSIAHVYDTETWEQVAHYRGRPETTEYAIDLANLGTMYGLCEVCVERTGPGLAVVKYMMGTDLEYPSVWHHVRSERDAKAGFTASVKTIAEAESDLSSIIRDMSLGLPGFIWNHPNTLDELFHAVVDDRGRTKSDKGWHKDEVSVCKMAATVLPLVSMRKKETPMEPPAPVTPYGNLSRGRR